MSVHKEMPGHGLQEQPTERFNQAINKGMRIAELRLIERFENNPLIEERRPYHNVQHSIRDVSGGVELILRTLQMIQNNMDITGQQVDPNSRVTERDIQLARIIGAFHDIRQDYQTMEVKDVEGKVIKIVRKRHTSPVLSLDQLNQLDAMQNRVEAEKQGGIEYASFCELKNYMEQVNSTEKGVFTKGDIALAREAIMATVPVFDPEGGVLQPYLNEGSSIIAAALAAADLDGCLLKGEYQFLEEGRRLFEEENLDLKRIINFADLTQVEKEKIQKRIIEAAQFQSILVVGRLKLLNSQLAPLPNT